MVIVKDPVVTNLLWPEHDEGITCADGVETQIEGPEPVQHCQVEDVFQIEAHKLGPSSLEQVRIFIN